MGYITSTLTRDEFHPAHIFATTFWVVYMFIQNVFARAKVREVTTSMCLCVCVCLPAHIAGGCSFSLCQCNVYISGESSINSCRDKVI